MKKYFLVTIVMAFNVFFSPTFGQTFTALGTIKHDGKILEMLSVSLDELGIDPKKDGYVKMVTKAMKMGLELCPSDSMFLSRASKMVRLDSDTHKFNAFIATAPYAKPGGEPAFFIPTIVSTSEDNKVELYYERVGLFYPEEIPDPFPPLYFVNTLGYRSIDTGFTPYDWIFIRVVGKPKL